MGKLEQLFASSDPLDVELEYKAQLKAPSKFAEIVRCTDKYNPCRNSKSRLKLLIQFTISLSMSFLIQRVTLKLSKD